MPSEGSRVTAADLCKQRAGAWHTCEANGGGMFQHGLGAVLPAVEVVHMAVWLTLAAVSFSAQLCAKVRATH